MMYPHLSNVSTATYTGQTSDDKLSTGTGGGGGTLRGNSFYSLNSNASHHSHHTAATMQSHHSNRSTHSQRSTASMHSDPAAYYHRASSQRSTHQSHYMAHGGQITHAHSLGHGGHGHAHYEEYHGHGQGQRHSRGHHGHTQRHSMHHAHAHGQQEMYAE